VSDALCSEINSLRHQPLPSDSYFEVFPLSDCARHSEINGLQHQLSHSDTHFEVDQLGVCVPHFEINEFLFEQALTFVADRVVKVDST
jgi:hypothetical protein